MVSWYFLNDFEMVPVAPIIIIIIIIIVLAQSLVQRSSTDCGASLCVIKKPCARGGHSPRWAAVPQDAIARAGLQCQRK
jgi:hypothetical protein